jgi:hypothetical protein
MRRVWLLLLLLMPGCGARQSVEENAPQSMVSLKRGGCRGSCPEYAVYLSSDGRVVFVGFRNVKVPGISVGGVSAARARDVIARFQRAGYTELLDQYTMGGSACGRYAADAPIVETSLVSGSRFKAIQRDGGCTDAPPILNELEKLIDEVAQTAKWVGQ